MTFTAGTSCQYSCAFCFVPAAMRKQDPWMKAHGVVGNHEDVVIRRENAVEIIRKQIMSKSETFRQEYHVIYSSPLVDVAANMELVRETVEICKVILSLTGWDIRLLSKSNLLPKVAQELEQWDLSLALTSNYPKPKARIIYGVSTGTLDDNLAKAFEQGTPLVSKRIQSLHWLQDNGFRTFGMICPSLPQEDYHRFAHSMFLALRPEMCEYVWAEVINVRGDSFTRTEKALRDAGYDLDADCLKLVSTDKASWERYARDTFLAHASQGYRQGQLRFLQYVTKETNPWWKAQEKDGAVIL